MADTEEELLKYGSDRSELAPITRGVRDVVDEEEVRELERDRNVLISRGVSNLTYGDIENIGDDPIYPAKETTLKMVSVVEKIPIPSVNQITGLTTSPANVFEKSEQIQYYTDVYSNEVSYPSSFVNTDGANINIKVVGDLTTQYVLVVKDTTNVQWYDWDNEEFNNGVTKKSGVIDGSNFNLIIPSKTNETVYHAYFEGVGSTNAASNLPTEKYPWVITQLKKPIVTFKFDYSDKFISDSNTTAIFNPGAALNVSTSLSSGTSIEMKVKPKRSTLSLKDNVGSKVSTQYIYNESSVDIIQVKSSELVASVNSDGSIGTISGTITLSESPLRDSCLLISPEQFFKIT
tara:strand:- start:6931 stop:7971 length:1041 start_codon:yes stop_codon:yes gene_type:complete